jgi:hypothetical protein
VGWKIANIQPVREPSKEIPAYRRNGPMSKVKITIDQNASSPTQSGALSKINRELGSKATIQGNIITVDQHDEGKVTAILNNAGLNYSRAEAP